MCLADAKSKFKPLSRLPFCVRCPLLPLLPAPRSWCLSAGRIAFRYRIKEIIQRETHKQHRCRRWAHSSDAGAPQRRRLAPPAGARALPGQGPAEAEARAEAGGRRQIARPERRIYLAGAHWGPVALGKLSLVIL